MSFIIILILLFPRSPFLYLSIVSFQAEATLLREKLAQEKKRLEESRRKVAIEADEARVELQERPKSEKADHKKMRKLIKSAMVETFDLMLLNDSSLKVSTPSLPDSFFYFENCLFHPSVCIIYSFYLKW